MPKGVRVFKKVIFFMLKSYFVEADNGIMRRLFTCNSFNQMFGTTIIYKTASIGSNQ